MNVGAFLDIDGTLYRDSLMVEHFKKLLKYEVIDASLWHTHAKETYSNWDKRQGNYDDYLLEIANIYLTSMKGLNQDHMEFISNQVIKLKGDRVYRYTRSRIDWHRKEGHKIIFISGSPEYLVSKMAQKYYATDYRGTNYVVDHKGNFTGEINQMWDADNKRNAILDFTKKYNIDLSKSYSYGDTNGDYSMFKMVGNPIAINPTKELLTNIKSDEDLSKKIKLIVERKDVIYEIDPSVTTFY
ncbi:MAG: HAD-IB family hydrolase [Anaeromicrobium sp.]|uniref:HAD family hydrolase n=1 Tax=Anaeromicrobium sp. TaxID=1929132 RepID=UPI0025E19FA6|nr:HAD-IB family hydrolase [Anaeromicrobium sp.]MCT4595492.1 HAD-IB family hydrolase [Anaeromicrobium sp.]